MNELPADIIRLIFLNLPSSKVLILSKANKRLERILDNLRFWITLFKREIRDKVNIPLNANIEWYREKLKIYPDVKILTELINMGQIKYKFKIYRLKCWDIFEMVENLKELNCQYKQLVSLPPMPNLEILHCDNNQLISLPLTPNLTYLTCDNNRLTFLTPMPDLEVLSCQNNRLTSLSFMTNLQILNCDNNQLTSLPPMPNLERLTCNNNKFTTLPKMPKLKQIYCDGNKLNYRYNIFLLPYIITLLIVIFSGYIFMVKIKEK